MGRLETANMLIMTLAYSQASGNGTFISKHVGISNSSDRVPSDELLL